MPISVSATGSWKQRPKAIMNFMVSARYSLMVPRNWISTSCPAIGSPVPNCWKLRKKS